MWRNRGEVVRRVGPDPYVGVSVDAKWDADKHEHQWVSRLDLAAGFGQGIGKSFSASGHSTGIGPVNKDT